MKIKALLILLGVVLLVGLLAFAGCGKKETPVTEEWQWPDRLIIATMGTTVGGYGASVAWSTPLGQDTGMTIRIIAEADVRLHEVWVRDGRVFTKSPHQNRAMLYANTGYARRDWGPYQSRIWMAQGVAYWGYATLGDSGITTPYDIKPGMKLLCITISEDPQQVMVALLAWGNVDPKDITWVPLSNPTQTAQFLMDGKGVITYGFPQTPAYYEVEASPHKLRWIELDAEKDPEGAERYLSWYPYASFGVATNAGVPSSEGVPMAVNISPMITRAETDPELVYRLVKWTDENYDRFKDGAPQCQTMTTEYLVALAKEHYEPLHDGAVRYLEEKGLWTPELQARQDYNIAQLTKWTDAYKTAIEMADDQGIVVNPDNKDWQTLWEGYRASLNLPLLMMGQGPGKEQPTYASYYTRWNEVKPFK